jgi:hypothetical protein
MRLYVALLLIHNAGPTPASDCRELRLAAALIKGTAQHRGGSVDCWPLDAVDAVTTAVLRAVFGVETVESRIDAFAEKLQWENEAPEVSGWLYGWSGAPIDLESMKVAQTTLLVALAMSGGRHIGENKQVLESWWRDLDKLESVARYCEEMRRRVLSNDFSSATPAVITLQMHLGTTGRVRSARLAIARAMKELRRVALFERVITLRALDVEEHEVWRLAEKIASGAFDPQRWPSSPSTTIRFVPGLVADQQSVTFDDDKKRYVTGISQQADAGLAEQLAEHVRRNALGWSLRKRLADAGLTPANTEALRGNYHATVAERQAFISAVGALCTALRSADAAPIVLVGHRIPASHLEPSKWGTDTWQCPLPAGVTIRNGDPSKGEPATALVNEGPVYEFDTPNGDCYVVPSAIVKTLEVGGSDPSSALSIRWTLLTDEKLQFVVSWKARF